jgi:peptidoglycan/LPS O-acetylase OafA/YrhL
MADKRDKSSPAATLVPSAGAPGAGAIPGASNPSDGARRLLGWFGIPGFYYVSLGGFAVTLFLVISGAVLQLQYGSTATAYGEFVAKRILRIYPIYYLSLLLGVGIYAARADLSKLGWADIPLSLTGFYAFAGKWGGPFVATSWYVGLIMVMYLLFPLLSRWIKKRPLVSLFTLLLVSVASRLLLGACEVLPNRPLDWFPLCRVFEFSLGIYIGAAVPRRFCDFGGGWGRAGTGVVFLSALSFPLFLMHHPLLAIVVDLPKDGTPLWQALLCYAVLTALASWAALRVDRRIPKARLLRALTRDRRRRSTPAG